MNRRHMAVAVFVLSATSVACEPAAPTASPSTTAVAISTHAHPGVGVLDVTTANRDGRPVEGVRIDAERLASCDSTAAVSSDAYGFSGLDGTRSFGGQQFGCYRIRASLSGNPQQLVNVELTESEPTAQVSFEYADQVSGTCAPRTVGAELKFDGDVRVDFCDVVWARATLGEHGDTSWIIRRVDDRWTRYMNLAERRCLSSTRADYLPPDLERYFNSAC